MAGFLRRKGERRAEGRQVSGAGPANNADVRLPASRAVRECIPVVLSTPSSWHLVRAAPGNQCTPQAAFGQGPCPLHPSWPAPAGQSRGQRLARSRINEAPVSPNAVASDPDKGAPCLSQGLRCPSQCMERSGCAQGVWDQWAGAPLTSGAAPEDAGSPEASAHSRDEGPAGGIAAGPRDHPPARGTCSCTGNL